MGAIYEEHKDEDGFLYIAYSGENTFGMWWKIFKINMSFTQLCFFAWIYFFVGGDKVGLVLKVLCGFKKKKLHNRELW